MKISFVTTIYRTGKDVEALAGLCFEAAASLDLDCEVVFVNDGSPDDGLEIAAALAQRDHRVVVVDLARNYGQHKALWTGLETASGDLIMMLDGDLEEDPRWAVDFHREMLRTAADVVYGVQIRPKGSLQYRFGRNAFYRMLDITSDFKFPRDVATARLMTRRYVTALLSHQERELFLVGLMHATGFTQSPYRVHKLSISESSYTLPKLMRLFLMAVTSFSIKPLIGVFFSGVILSGLAFLLIIFLIGRFLVTGVSVEGWTSVVAGMMLLNGVTILFVGVLSIYIGTIFLEVKQRPRTIVTRIYRAGKEQGPNKSRRLGDGAHELDG